MKKPRLAIIGGGHETADMIAHIEAVSSTSPLTCCEPQVFEYSLYPKPSRFSFGVPYRDELRHVDIKSEYALIQQKKSKLSARLRRMVVKRVEAHNALGSPSSERGTSESE